jgi:hypothetical protein
MLYMKPKILHRMMVLIHNFVTEKSAQFRKLKITVLRTKVYFVSNKYPNKCLDINY